MPRVDHAGADVGLYVAGVYGRLRDRELERIDRPDPRLFLEGAGADAVAASPRDVPLLDVEALAAGAPIEVPRWMLGGHQVPEVRDWPVYADRMITSFVVSADDVVRPA